MPVRKIDLDSGIAVRYPIVGSNGLSVHTVTRFNTGFWGCECVGWVNHKAKLEDHTVSAPAKHHCSHVLKALALYQAGIAPTTRVMLQTPLAATRGREGRRAAAVGGGEDV